MQKQLQKTKEAPPRLQNGAENGQPRPLIKSLNKPPSERVILKLLREVKEEELVAFESTETGVTWLASFIDKYLVEMTDILMKAKDGKNSD